MPRGAVRDPVSEWLDDGARALLARAYAAAPDWVMTRLADPEPRHVQAAAALGIDLWARDRPSTASRRGGLDARSRWARAFVRALYDQHKWWSKPGGGWRGQRAMVARHAGGLEVAVGVALPTRGIIPAGRMISVRLRPGGARKERYMAGQSDADKAYTDDDQPAGRWSNPARRDW